MDLSIITVSWNSAKNIKEQIKSAAAGCVNVSFEQLVVDNGSTDATTQIIKTSFQNVKLLERPDNPGFAVSNNLAAARARGDFLLFLNPDMRIMPGSLDIMVNWMRVHPETGLASCKLVNALGAVNENAMPRRLPGVLDQLAIIFKIPHIFPSVLNSYLFKNLDQGREQEVDSVRGSFMIMRHEVYNKLGFAFDPRYYIWFEDVDICREVKRLGFKVIYTPVISCVDYVGQSFKQRTTLWKQKQFTKSMLIYFKKWEPAYIWIWIALARPLGIIMAWGNDVYQQSRQSKRNKQ